jgi:hypothetical protein
MRGASGADGVNSGRGMTSGTRATSGWGGVACRCEIGRCSSGMTISTLSTCGSAIWTDRRPGMKTINSAWMRIEAAKAI